MTNHGLLAFIYDNSPCAHVDIDFEFGCGIPKASLVTCHLIIAGALDYDLEAGLFSYREGWWL